MMPLLDQRTDLVRVIPCGQKLKPHDLPLYRRPSGELVLHRIVKVRQKDYVILGDNCLNKEYGITDADIFGVLTRFVHRGKEYSVTHPGYRLYAVIWYAIYPMRRFIKKLICFLKGSK